MFTPISLISDMTIILISTPFAMLSVLLLSSISWTGTDAVYKLQNDSKPISYILHMEPHIMKNHFNGSVIIDFIMTITTSKLTINQNSLNIETVEIEGIPLREWDADNDEQVLILYCKSDLIEGHIYRVKIEFGGTFDPTKYGVYKSKYIIGNETRWIAATQFEATRARKAFPCWDEPAYKAVFNISIKHLRNYTTVISNMPILNQTHNDDNTITTYFYRTMLMSTYLVAFVVSDYAYYTHADKRFNMYTNPATIHQTELAYNFSLEALKVLDVYTEIPYFGIHPKLDQVSIRDAKSNAMENWGLITYKEEYLLYEEGVSTSRDKNTVISTVAHEFTHQWFGNLVSPQWWDYTWLNEGFAKYFQYFVIDKVNPSWRAMDIFPLECMQSSAFITDGKKSNPLNRKVDHPDEINASFDNISYRKGASILRMLSHILSEQVFRTGLKNYLRENSFGVADSDNLIKHLQNAAGVNKKWSSVSLSIIVQAWLTESGYPMVTVDKTIRDHFTVTQNHFSYYTADKEKSWWIPITYASNHSLNFTNTAVTHWMQPKIKNLMIHEPESDWILLNKQQIGYFRVNYNNQIWQKLIDYLKSSNMHKIHPVNRAQLIDDALAMAHVKRIKYETALSLTLYLHREIDYIPWMSTFRNLEFLRHKIYPSRYYYIFKHYIKYIMHSLTKNLTYVASPKDDHPTKLLKANAMKWACIADVQECLNESRKEFKAWLKDPNHHLDPDLKPTILCTGLRTASEAVWDEALTKLTQETFDKEKRTSPLEVLGCSNNRRILQKFLLYSCRKDPNIRFETAARAVIANTNVRGDQIVQSILDSQYKKIMKIDDFDQQLLNVIKYLAAAITNNNDFLKLSTFIVKKRDSDSSAISKVSQAMRNIKWIASFGGEIDEWLLENKGLFTSRATGKTFVSLLLILSIFDTIMFKIFFYPVTL